ncbi:AMIN-like domain-containing (lipo)protein [Crossiella sp. CA198]|uniref:AMIN-like domain-containing (lipo)protein n=1 Tax=Crossiella sp. CA198 TaxID=3455607 RepID=UPI003F8D830F
MSVLRRLAVVVTSLFAVVAVVTPAVAVAAVAAPPGVKFRAGSHDGFDRVVFEFVGAKAPGSVLFQQLDGERPYWGQSDLRVTELWGNRFLKLALPSPAGAEPYVEVIGKRVVNYPLPLVRGAVVNEAGHGGSMEVSIGLERDAGYTVKHQGHLVIIDFKR